MELRPGLSDPELGAPIELLVDTLWILQQPVSAAVDLGIVIQSKFEADYDESPLISNLSTALNDNQYTIAARTTFSGDTRLDVNEPTPKLLADLALSIQPPWSVETDTVFTVFNERPAAFDTSQIIEKRAISLTDSLIEVAEFGHTHFDIKQTIYLVRLRAEHPITT